MPRLAICSCDLHWHWINWTLLCDAMEVSMLRLVWLTTAQHVFQPALTGKLELVSRKNCLPWTKAITVSKFREKLSPANWVQGVIAISPKISHSWAPKMGSNMRPRYIQFRDIHDGDILGVHCIGQHQNRTRATSINSLSFTMLCHYNKVNFCQNTLNRTPIISKLAHKERAGLSFVRSNSWCSASVTTLLFTVSC